MTLPTSTCGDTRPPGKPGPGGCNTAIPSTCGRGLRGTRPRAVGGTGRPLDKTFFLYCQRRHPELPKIPTHPPLYFPYCHGLRLTLPLASRTSLGATAIWRNLRGKVVSSNDHVLVRIELHGAFVELAFKQKISSGSWSCQHYAKLFTFMLTSTQS